MIRLRRHHVIAIVIALLIILPFIAAAEVSGGLPRQIVPEGCHGPDCTCQHLIDLAQNLLNAGIFIAIFLSAGLFAWAGFRYLTNTVNPGKRNEAKETLWNVVIGLVIVLAAWLVVDTLIKTLGANLQGTGIWSAICG